MRLGPFWLGACLLLPLAAADPSASSTANDAGWSFDACAGETEALAQWVVVARDVILSAGYWLLAPDECYHMEGTTPGMLVDCTLIELTLTPLAGAAAPLSSLSVRCEGLPR